MNDMCVLMLMTLSVSVFGDGASSALAAQTNNGGSSVVDLSKDFEVSTSVSSSPGAVALQEIASADPMIRTALVLENGKIVANYARDDVDVDEPYQVWSTTKSWMSLIIGLLVQDGVLSINDTLGDIFTNKDVWTNATDVDFRKAVTIEELLTMSSGLVSPPFPENLSEVEVAAAFAQVFDGGSGGGGSLASSLDYPEIGEKGEFSYLGISNILSYVVVEKTGGVTPRQYLADNVLPDLGINNDGINWWKNEDGVEYSFHGLELTPIQMAKFGQLYLQNGTSSPGSQLIQSSWVADSFTPYLSFITETTAGNNVSATYGYLFWSAPPTGFNNGLTIPDPSNVWCAIGAGGQDICVNAHLGRVSVQQRDFTATDNGTGAGAILPVAMNPELSFDVLTNLDSNTTQADDNVDNSSTAHASGSSILTSIIGAFVAGFLMQIISVM